MPRHQLRAPQGALTPWHLGNPLRTTAPTLLASRAVHRIALRQAPLRQPRLVASGINTGQETATAKDDRKVGVLFVCLGNICRSPTAEAVFRSTVEKAGLQNRFTIDSCGTGGGNPEWYQDGGWSYHEGDPADPRMTVAAQNRGIRLTSRARPLKPEDFHRFEYIVCMDKKNAVDVQTAAEHWSAKHPIPADYRNRLKLMTTFCSKFKRDEVPDPYFGGSKGFEIVLDLLQDSCEGLLSRIEEGYS